jgi:hypothetical protein
VQATVQGRGLLPSATKPCLAQAIVEGREGGLPPQLYAQPLVGTPACAALPEGQRWREAHHRLLRVGRADRRHGQMLLLRLLPLVVAAAAAAAAAATTTRTATSARSCQARLAENGVGGGSMQLGRR